MAHRQVETTSIHSSTYHTGWIRISPVGPWQVVAHSNTENADTEGENVLPCTYLDLATQIHMQRSGLKKYPKSFRWNKDVNFNENLRLPVEVGSSVDDTKGILVLFEAMASEGVTVALSSQPAFQRGSTLEITFGATGNTKTTIVKKGNTSTSQVSIPCRVCQEGTWNSFWVCQWQGNTYAGVGNSPGEKCVAILKKEDSSDNNRQSATTDADDKEGDADESKTADDKTDANPGGGDDNLSDDKTKSPIRYVGIGNAAQQGRAIKVRNVYVTLVPSFVALQLDFTTDSSTMDVLMDQQDEIDDEALKEYQEQCRKAKARAEKFGVPYKEPDLAAVVPWSQARKLRANPQKGFITGIDVTDPEELAKQEARKSRFGVASKKRELEEGNEEEEKEGEVSNNTDDAAEEKANKEALPVVQAWDNEELVRFQRVDPPSALWKNPPEGETEGETETGTDEFAMETDKPTLTPEKIHVFSIDWSAFKQIRTEDLMSYFTIYGPSYVEWLGDLSCNILFEDKFSAVRAMKAMAQDLPSPPPKSLNEDDDEYVPPDFGAMGWKLGHGMVRKIKNDRFGRRGTTARVLMRPATSLDILVERPSTWPNPPPGFSTKRILGPGDDYNTNPVDDDEEVDDDNNGRRRKRRRRNSDRERQPNNNKNNSHNGNNNNSNGKRNRNDGAGKRRQRAKDSSSSQTSAADRLNQGLSSGRAGFSVEEMEALRAAKKN